MTIQKLPGTAIVPGTVTVVQLESSVATTVQTGGGPKLTNIQVTDNAYTVLDDTAVSIAGGYIKITGTGFVTGCSIIVGSLVATSVSFISSTEVRAQVPAQAAGTYTVYLVNPDGGVGIRVNGLNYSSTPTWTTTSPLGDGSIDNAISVQFVATSNSAVTYALEAGSTLPAGLSLSSSGLLTGTVTGITVDTTYNFTVVATDAENQDTPQAFSITITISDPNFKNTVLLLQADTAPTVISDASTNNFDLTVYGDARASNFTPYGTGWSYYFPAGAYLTTSTLGNTLGTGDFCMECWVYSNSYATNYAAHIVITCSAQTIYLQTSGSALRFLDFTSPTSNFVIGGGSVVNGRWHHIVGTRQSGTVRGFIDGKLVATQSSMNFNYGTVTNIQVSGTIDSHIAGAKVTIGSVPAAYQTSSTTLNSNIFAVPTGYVSSEANTLLLTAQTNRFINQVNNTSFATISGSPKIVSFYPFNITNTGVNGSAYFDGTGDYITVPDNANLEPLGGNFTIETWFYLNAVTTGTQICGKSWWTPFYIEGSNLVTYLSSNGSTWDIASNQVIITSVATFRWYHVAMVRNGTSIKVYVNGTETLSLTSSAALHDGSDTFTIGARGTTYLNGYVADLRFVKGTAVYTANFTPPTSPLTAISNTQLLTLQYDQPHNNHTFLDSSSNQFLITRNGNTTQGTFSPFSQSGHSVYFDGNGDYLAIADNAALRLGTGDFTIEFYINVGPVGSHKNQSGGVDNYPRVISKGLYGSTTGIDIGYDSTGGKSIYWSDKIGTDAVEPNTWYHVAFTRSGTTWRVFKDGILKGSNTYAGYDISDTGEVHIARLAYSAGGFGNMNCYISNLRIVKGTALYTTNFTPSTTPLTSVANTSLLACHANRFIDGSANNFTVTRNGDARVTAFGPFSTTAYSATSNGGSAYFDGTGDYLSYGSNAIFGFGTADFTVEAWVYIAASADFSIFNVGGGAAGSYGLYWIGSTSKFESVRYGDTAGSGRTTNTYGIGQWYHIAASRSGGTARLFINGNIDAGSTYAMGSVTATAAETGRIWQGSALNNGYISNLRVITGTALYTANFTPPTAPLTATTNTSLLLNFTNAGVIDSTGKNVIETVGNAGVVTAIKKFGTGSMYFDGTGDVAIVPNSALFTLGTNNFTIESWVYVTQQTTNQYYSIFGKRPSTGNQSYIALSIRNNLAIFHFAGSNSGAWSSLTTGNINIPLNTWTHIALARNGSAFNVYINGTRDSGASITSAASVIDNSTPFYIGTGTTDTGGEFFVGYLADFRFTNGYARYVTGTGANAGQMVFNGTNTLALPTKALPDRGRAS